MKKSYATRYIFFFVASLLSEYFIMRAMLHEYPRHQVWRAALLGNFYSYLIFLVLDGIAFIYSL